MFCSFGVSPRIMRFFCTGHVVEWDQPSFATILLKMAKKRLEGARAIILLDVWKVGTILFSTRRSFCIRGIPNPTNTKIVSRWGLGANKLRFWRSLPHINPDPNPADVRKGDRSSRTASQRSRHAGSLGIEAMPKECSSFISGAEQRC